MEMLKRNEKRRRLFAVAIFLGVSTATATVAASQTEYIKSNELPVVEMEFFNEGEFSSSQNFSKAIVDTAKFGATYWRDVLSLQATNQSPWQIALTATAQPIINAKTFSFNQAIPVQDNYLAQMLQHNRTLV
ncbi:MAG: hypothetical protein J5497_06555, partial [Selenomonadaceae bacterium]|nr:hypothetical protein [Selenomonadaceae bacterium]